MSFTRREMCLLLPALLPVAAELQAFGQDKPLPSGAFSFDKAPMHVANNNAQVRMMTGSAEVAIEKARTAVRFKRPSKAFQDVVAGGGPGLRILGLPGVVPIEGGIPLIIDGQIVGAIGVSGDSSDHDGICAQAGVGTLK